MPVSEVKIKICGIYRPGDAAILNEAEPDYFGMVINFPKSHRNLTPAQAREVRGLVKRQIPAVGVFVNQPIDLICTLLEEGTINVAQLHGQESPADIEAIQTRTGKPVWKAFRVRTPEDVRAAQDSPADLILLDNGYGTGQTFDWNLAGGVGRPFALAGGLTPENLPAAIRLLHPVLVDLSSGVETDKAKDRNKVLRAVRAVRGADGYPAMI